MIASMRKPAISADLQATRKRAMLMENYELGKVGLEERPGVKPNLLTTKMMYAKSEYLLWQDQ